MLGWSKELHLADAI